MNIYLVREKCGDLYLVASDIKPRKYEEKGEWGVYNAKYVKLDSKAFPEVEWTDREPSELVLLRSLYKNTQPRKTEMYEYVKLLRDRYDRLRHIPCGIRCLDYTF